MRSTIDVVSFIVIVSLTIVSQCKCLYFHIGETEKRCFIEEIPDETLLLIDYKLQLHDPTTGGFMQTSPGLAMHIDIRDPDDKLVLSKVYAAEGQVAFTSHKPGEHVICIQSNSTQWFSGGKLRVHFDIKTGEHAMDYDAILEKEKYSSAQLAIRKLQDQANRATKELNYQREVEKDFRGLSESTNNSMFYWTIVQIVVLAVVTVGQGWYLKRFFISKKLV